MPDTNRRRSSRHLRLLVRATRQIPVSASPHLGHPEDWGWRQARTDRQSPDLLTCYRETTSVHNRPVLSLLFRMSLCGNHFGRSVLLCPAAAWQGIILSALFSIV